MGCVPGADPIQRHNPEAKLTKLRGSQTHTLHAWTSTTDFHDL